MKASPNEVEEQKQLEKEIFEEVGFEHEASQLAQTHTHTHIYIYTYDVHVLMSLMSQHVRQSEVLQTLC